MSAICPSCHGTGGMLIIDPDTGQPVWVACPTCGGQGSV